jgi:hypothetical protein
LEVRVVGGRLMVNMIPKSIEAISKNLALHCQLGTFEYFRKEWKILPDSKELSWAMKKWNEKSGKERKSSRCYMIKIEYYVIWNENEIDFTK